jgi:hypothetical protein
MESSLREIRKKNCEQGLGYPKLVNLLNRSPYSLVPAITVDSPLFYKALATLLKPLWQHRPRHLQMRPRRSCVSKDVVRRLDNIADHFSNEVGGDI